MEPVSTQEQRLCSSCMSDSRFGTVYCHYASITTLRQKKKRALNHINILTKYIICSMYKVKVGLLHAWTEHELFTGCVCLCIPECHNRVKLSSRKAHFTQVILHIIKCTSGGITRGVGPGVGQTNIAHKGCTSLPWRQVQQYAKAI